MTVESLTDVPRGLDGVVVGTTSISDVNGKDGLLSYRGFSVDELVGRSFSEVAALVVFGCDRPDIAARLDTQQSLGRQSHQIVSAVSSGLHPMHLLQGVLPLLDHDGPFSDEGEAGIGLNLALQVPEVLMAHLLRERQAQRGPSARAGFNERFLDGIQAPNSDAATRAFNTMQILQLEHSFNASTFAARVIASTLAPIQNALAGGIGTLHGVLHGGADQAALEMADQVGNAGKAAAFVDHCLASGKKIMGMGHREYRVVDPRAKYAKALAAEVSADTQHYETYLTLEAIEARFTQRMGEKGKEIHANIEFYKGLIFRVLGLPTHYFTAMFAMARIFGYIAHVVESREGNRLIRPAARYRPSALEADHARLLNA